MVARADSAWNAGEFAAARALYQRLVTADSNASSRAVYRLGVLLSWDNQLAASIRLHQLYVRLEPRDLEGRVGLGRVYAWASLFPASIATFDTVLMREADYRDAALGRAQAMGWWGHLDDAIAAYRAWRGTHPADVEAALAHARTLAWKGALRDAEALYDSLGTRGGAEAAKGAARVQAWRGDLGRSELAWQRLAAEFPRDPETWVGMAQVQRWMGRPFAAQVALDEALRVRPGYDDARQQMRWVRAEIAPQLSVSVLHSEDSERNMLEALRVGYDASRPWGGRWSLGAEQKRVTQGIAAAATSLRGGLLWEPRHSRASLRAEVGASRLDPRGSANPVRDVVVASVRYATAIGGRANVSVGAQRVPFDDVRATIERGLVFSAIEADASLQLGTRLTMSASTGAGRVVGDLDAPRTRTSALVRARWSIRRGVAFIATARTFEWNRPAFGVFFAPQRYALAEFGAEWDRARDLGLVLRADAGLGTQSVRFETDASVHRTVPRGSLITGWRFAPGREILATFVYANVASTTTLRQGDYRYSSVSLGSRFAF